MLTAGHNIHWHCILQYGSDKHPTEADCPGGWRTNGDFNQCGKFSPKVEGACEDYEVRVPKSGFRLVPKSAPGSYIVAEDTRRGAEVLVTTGDATASVFILVDRQDDAEGTQFRIALQ